MAHTPSFQEEALLCKQGNAFVFGIDEAGRGCLAGPVCAAVAAWPQRSEQEPLDHLPVRDSKQMSEAQREAAFLPIQDLTLASGIGWASAKEIDRWNILRATYLAVARALESALKEMIDNKYISLETLTISKFAFLTDGSHPLLNKAVQIFVRSPEYAKEFPLLGILAQKEILEKCVVKGDSKVFSIASASVLAKVSRDHLMQELDRKLPAYEFALHKGYPTAKHVANLRRVGPSSEHRMSFTPVAESARQFGMA